MQEVESFFSLRRFAHRGLWQEGQPVWQPLSLLEEYIKGQKSFEIAIEYPRHAYLERLESISIKEGTVIEPGAYIQGPCLIGKGCIIRHGAYLRGPVILGDHCIVGHGAEIKHSILLDFAAATHLVYVGNSILGSRVNLGAGVKCANLRLDRKGVAVSWEGKRVKTGLAKFGAILGDRVQVGCNVVFSPGTLVGRESVCYPLLNIRGTIPPYSRVKGSLDWTAEPLKKTALQAIGG